jgi:hypothetical protein
LGIVATSRAPVWFNFRRFARAPLGFEGVADNVDALQSRERALRF